MAYDSTKASTTPTFKATIKAELCDRTHFENNGIINSPKNNWGRYPGNLNCKIRIEVQTQFKIQIYFYTFALEASDKCVNDYVTVKYSILIF